MSEPKRGRPPIANDDPSVGVHLRLPSKQYDSIYERAQRAKTTVPDLIRRVLNGTDEDEFRHLK
jgi:hypothetical protein